MGGYRKNLGWFHEGWKMDVLRGGPFRDSVGPSFSHVEISTNTKWPQNFVSNTHGNGRAPCQFWTFSSKFACFVMYDQFSGFLNRKNCSKCINGSNWKQFCMCALFDAGNTWKIVGGNTHISWWSCFTKWTAQDEGSGCSLGIHRCDGTVMNPF